MQPSLGYSEQFSMMPMPALSEAPAIFIARSIARMFEQFGHASLTEFSLANGRRADLLALDRRGEIAIVEVKSSLADFRADRKWPEYRDYCDALYFGIGPDFPREIIPEECGLIVADRFGALILRESGKTPLAASRRRAVTLQFALTAAQRLRQVIDPPL